MGSLLSIILTLAVIGFILYLIVTYIPMPEPFKQVMIVIAVVALIIWLIGGATGNFSFPKL